MKIKLFLLSINLLIVSCASAVMTRNVLIRSPKADIKDIKAPVTTEHNLRQLIEFVHGVETTKYSEILFGDHTVTYGSKEAANSITPEVLATLADNGAEVRL